MSAMSRQPPTFAHVIEGNPVKSHSLRHVVRAARLGLVAMLAASQLATASDEQPGIDLIGVNLSGAFYGTKAAAKAMGSDPLIYFES